MRKSIFFLLNSKFGKIIFVGDDKEFIPFSYYFFVSGAGLKKCGMAGAVGLGAAALWSLVLKRDRRLSDYI